jgi:maltooligosyltrehalose trehalohydrolase
MSTDARIHGAVYAKDGTCTFSVWAPEKKKMILHLVAPRELKVEMDKDETGYFHAELNHVPPGTRYFFMPEEGEDIPDPASHFQPLGVKGPSEIVDHDAFVWEDETWRGKPLEDLILYELHIGTFTEEGTFEAVIPRLDDLLDTGINALEIMPVSQFSGERNWGYDGVFPYAVQHSYGGPQGLKKLVNACHKKGISVILDVVYNHIGPEGNWFEHYAPYFTDTYRTPWGNAINFDGEWSDGVRDYFSGNPVYWFSKFHIDGLRLDAIHAVFDTSAEHFWELCHRRIKVLERQVARPLYMIAESDFNSPKVVTPVEEGGVGFDAQWLDDFHHALYVLLDKHGKKRYEDFGTIEQLEKAFNEGFVMSGNYVKFRKRRYGASSSGIPPNRFFAFTMNHDQVGNRVHAERLCALIDFERLKLAAAAVLLSPYIPMLFMGEEYADESPFFYFISHEDPELINAVREGRKKEFSAFASEGEPPDAYALETFHASKLQWEKRNQGKHAIIRAWHKKLITMRRDYAAMRSYTRKDSHASVIGKKGLLLHRKNNDEHILCFLNFGEEEYIYPAATYTSQWRKVLDSRDDQWCMTENSNSGNHPEQLQAGEVIRVHPVSVVVYSSSPDGMPLS